MVQLIVLMGLMNDIATALAMNLSTLNAMMALASILVCNVTRNMIALMDQMNMDAHVT